MSKVKKTTLSASSPLIDDDSSDEEWIFEGDSSDEDTTNDESSTISISSEEEAKLEIPNEESKPKKKKKSSKKDKEKGKDSKTKQELPVPKDEAPKPPKELIDNSTSNIASSSIGTPSSNRPVKKKRVKMQQQKKGAMRKPLPLGASVDTAKSSCNSKPQLKNISLEEPIGSDNDDDVDDLANQIATLRIIASNGRDTKYLSIRSTKGSLSTPTPLPETSNPFTGKTVNGPRMNIVSEIVNTEQTYVNDLEILIRIYLEPLSTRRNKKKKPIITKEQVRTLFSNIESILNLNRVLLADLIRQSELPPEEQRIGSSFNLIAKCLLLYTDYCSNQKQADDLYTNLKANNSEFIALMEENMAKPESRGLDLNAFLIKPVQRACKYPLLLKELLKQTPETHVDYEELKEAFEAMQTSCMKLNERKRDVENMSHFLTIKARTGKNFIESGRTFIDDGHIGLITEKGNRRSSKVKFRLRKGRYVLFSDMVVFIVEGKVVAQISLSTCKVQDPKLKDHPLALLLVARASRLILLPNSEAQKNTIGSLIMEQIGQLQARSLQRRKLAMQQRQNTTPN